MHVELDIHDHQLDVRRLRDDRGQEAPQDALTRFRGGTRAAQAAARVRPAPRRGTVTVNVEPVPGALSSET
jgi:hypothetical protein